MENTITSNTMKFGVITVSDRSFRGTREDVSGQRACDLLGTLGSVVFRTLVPDETAPIQNSVIQAVDAGADIIITTGGTGITRRDRTPDAVGSILFYDIPGLPELIRSTSQVRTAALTRSRAGVVDHEGRRSCVICLPGSPNGVTEGISCLSPLFHHVVEQLNDADHPAHEAHPHADHLPHAAITRQLAKLSEENTHSTPKKNRREDQILTDPEGGVVTAKIQDTEISMAELEAAVQSDRAGAVLSFCGQVRNHDQGRAVESIDYEAHPNAAEVLHTIAGEVAQTAGLCSIAVIHRYGLLKVGEVALGAAISAEHRHEAYEAMETLINRIKLELPVWKKQKFTEGGSQWSGLT